ncbi:MAG: aldo/keto reductase [Thermoanaerobaculia bacterium]
MISRRDAIRLAVTAGTALAAGVARSAPREVMRSKPIPSSGEPLPVIGLGTWQTFDVADGDRARLERVLTEFVAAGGKLVDSSPMYGRSESVLGALKMKLGLHRSLFVATKVWTSGRDAGIEQMQHSERELHTRPIDLMQVHNLVDAGTHIPVLQEWKRQERVRYIGVTHYTSSAYGEVERVIRRETLDFLQINYSLTERDAEQRLLGLAAERGMAVIANRPFAGGQLFSRVKGRTLPAWTAEIGCGTWAQLFLKWIVSHPAVTCAVPATDDVRHLTDNVQAGFGALADQAMRRRIASLIDSM